MLHTMSFRAYLESHYVAACNQRPSILVDDKMIAMLQEGRRDLDLVKSWMRAYGLLQGITGSQRDAIANCFLDFAAAHVRHINVIY